LYILEFRSENVTSVFEKADKKIDVMITFRAGHQF